MPHTEDPKTPKHDANRDLPIEKVVTAKREMWLRENVDAIAAYNDFSEENGLALGGTE
jgi:hypothetical protein